MDVRLIVVMDGWTIVNEVKDGWLKGIGWIKELVVAYLKEWLWIVASKVSNRNRVEESIDY